MRGGDAGARNDEWQAAWGDRVQQTRGGADVDGANAWCGVAPVRGGGGVGRAARPWRRWRRLGKLWVNR
jgi:hypothetical protein